MPDQHFSSLINSGSPPTWGRVDAPVTMAIFTDFECPYCKRLSQMLDKLPPGDLHDTRIIFRNFPLDMHPWARSAAKAAACAELQDETAFWEVQKEIFNNQNRITLDTAQATIRGFLRERSQLDQKQVDTCIEKDLTLGMISRDLELGKQLRISGTPTVFVNGERVRGFKDENDLKAIIEKAREKAKYIVNEMPTTAK